MYVHTYVYIGASPPTCSLCSFFLKALCNVLNAQVEGGTFLAVGHRIVASSPSPSHHRHRPLIITIVSRPGGGPGGLPGEPGGPGKLPGAQEGLPAPKATLPRAGSGPLGAGAWGRQNAVRNKESKKSPPIRPLARAFLGQIATPAPSPFRCSRPPDMAEYRVATIDRVAGEWVYLVPMPDAAHALLSLPVEVREHYVGQNVLELKWILLFYKIEVPTCLPHPRPSPLAPSSFHILAPPLPSHHPPSSFLFGLAAHVLESSSDPDRPSRSARQLEVPHAPA